MLGTYNLWLMAVSFVVATLASYTALDLTGRISLLASSRLRHAWLAGGAAAMGVGIWSMHFIAMLALSLPIPLGYDFALTGDSLAIAVVVSYFALFVTTRAQLTPSHLVAGSVLMGLGIAGMHYTGMAAMRMRPGIDYQPAWFTASLAIAIAASMAALLIARKLRDDTGYHVKRTRIGAALVMAMTLFTFAILIVTLMLSRFDARTTFLVSAVSNLNGQIVRLATLDTLTGLPNRTTLTERIDAAIELARRRNSVFGILFMDLDGFKTINDSLGHSAGDQVLAAFAQRLQSCVRATDTVARLGGDEFVVMSENLVARQDAGLIAEGVLERMREGVWSDNEPLQVMPSIGIALYPQDGDSVDTLLKHADAAMYEAKRAGRSTYRFFETSMNDAATRTLQIQNAL